MNALDFAAVNASAAARRHGAIIRADFVNGAPVWAKLEVRNGRVVSVYARTSDADRAQLWIDQIDRRVG